VVADCHLGLCMNDEVYRFKQTVVQSEVVDLHDLPGAFTHLFGDKVFIG
jgi:hypothetical protein